MIKKGEKQCPYCGGELQKRGTVKRTIKFGDCKKIFYLMRYSCKQCGRWHRELPIDILPYKQYPKEIVEGFASNELNNEIEQFLDFPSEASINRWKKH